MSRSVLAEMSSWLWSIYYCNYLFHAGSGAGYFRSLFCGDNWIIDERLAEISESAKDVSVFWKAPFCKTRTDYAKGRQESQQPAESQIITICIEIPHSAAFAGIISEKLLSFYIFKNLLKVQFFPS